MIWTILLYACLLAMQYCIGKTEGSNQTTWFVNATANSSESRHNYDRRFDSLNEALAALSAFSKMTKVTNLTLLIGRGKHFVSGVFAIIGCDYLTIASEESDKNSVFLEFNATDPTLTSEVQFINNTNIALLYLTARMIVPGGRSMFSIFQCNHVIVKKCDFINTLSTSISLLFFNSEDVHVSFSTFFFTVSVKKSRNETSSLLYAHSYSSKNATRLALNVSNCQFTSNETRPFVGYGSIGEAREMPIQDSGLLVIVVTSRNLNIILDNCQVSRLADAFAVPVVISMINGSFHNTVTLSHFHIYDNKCVAGCGIVSVFNRSAANTISITDSYFINNTAVIEGGAGMAYFSRDDVDSQLRNIVHYQRCQFRDNVAVEAFGAGSAFMSLSTQELSGGNVMQLQETAIQAKVQFTDCTFANNLALRGVVFAKNSDVTFDGFCQFVNNKGGGIHAQKSIVTLSGRHEFTNNSAVRNGGALLLEMWSRANFRKVERIDFVSNSALFHGGAIYADDTSSSEIALDMLHTMSGTDTAVDCFLNLTSDIYFSYDGYDSQANVQFWNNSAGHSGRDIYATTFRLCNASSMSPERKRIHANKTYPISSAPTFMQFLSASCKCYKTINWRTLKFKSGNCNRDDIIKKIETEVSDDNIRRMNSSLECWNETKAAIFSKAFPLSEYYIPPRIFPKGLWVPFGDCLLSQYMEENSRMSIRVPGVRSTFCNYDVSHSPSFLTLNPSPGEKFQLTFNIWDEFYNEANDLASLVVKSFDSAYGIPEALIRHAGTEYGHLSPFYFNALQPINDLSIVGPVGARGILHIKWRSFLRGLSCPLYIYFELAPCHQGFNSPRANATWTADYIAKATTRSESEASSDLECTCSNKDGIYCEYDGKTVMVGNDYWAGELMTSTNSNETIEKEFSTHLCIGLCSDQRSSFYSDHWKLDPEFPDKHCNDNRTGVLCAVCSVNYSEVPASKNCRDCRGFWKKGLALSVALAVVVGALVVYLAMTTPLLNSPIFESWVFFIQIVPLVVQPDSDALVNDFAGYTVSVLQLNAAWCVLPGLAPLDRLVGQAVPSLYLVFLVLLLFLSSHIAPLSRYIKRARVADTFLLVILISYEPLASFACFSLSCTIEVEGKVRLWENPEVVCFSSQHLPYAITAIIILVSFLIPLPLVLLLNFHSIDNCTEDITWMKRVCRSCAARYKKGRQWWIGLSLWRRLVVTIVAATATVDMQSRQIALFITCVFLFFTNVMFPPYKTNMANNYSFLLAANLTLIAAFSTNDLSVLSQTKQFVFPIIILLLLSWPTVIIIFIAIPRHWWGYLERFYHLLKRRVTRQENETATCNSDSLRAQRSQSVESEMENVVHNTELLRDPLLDSGKF